jgi:hypothetical protein
MTCELESAKGNSATRPPDTCPIVLRPVADRRVVTRDGVSLFPFVPFSGFQEGVLSPELFRYAWPLCQPTESSLTSGSGSLLTRFRWWGRTRCVCTK